jgi:hypothetical protein
MKRYTTLLISTLTYFILWGFLITPASAASSPVEKTVESVKEQINSLINAKDVDTKEEDTLDLRKDILTKAIDISIEEAKDLKTKLGDIKENEEQKADWVKKSIEKLDEIISYYQSQKKIIEKNEFESIDDVKNLAQEVKEWRQENAKKPIAEIHEYFLLREQCSAIDTAETRYIKIKADIEKLERLKMNVEEAKKLLERSYGKIRESRDYLTIANNAFWNKVLTEEKSVMKTLATDEKTDTSIEKEDTKTQELVKDSLGKIKEAYQVYIEISNSVRKLLK